MISKQGAQSRIAGFLNSWAKRIEPDGYYGLGSKSLPRNSPRALIIYTTQYLHKVLYNQHVDQAWVNSHSGFWESLEMLRLLNEAGYVVDYLNSWKDGLTIDWDAYDLVIDERDNLRHCSSSRPIKVFYCTGVYWLKQNRDELIRIESFLRRTGVKTSAKRQVKPILSDQYSDLITYFGSESQLEFLSPKYGFVPLDISCVTEPKEVSRNISTARNTFVWFGGAGCIHKGADLTIEAFKRLPNAKLHILGGINEDEEFKVWLKKVDAENANIEFNGWMDTASEVFQNLLNNAIGVILPSASEGGAGSVAQTMHYGLVPIVTASTHFRCATELAFVVDETEPERIIGGIVDAVQKIMTLPEEHLQQLSDGCRAYAQQNFTRKAYSASFKKLLTRITELQQTRKGL